MFCRLVVLIVLLAIISPVVGIFALESDLGPIATRDLIVHLKLDKSQYLIFEPIQYRLWVENTGDDFEYFSEEDVREVTVLDAKGDLAPVGRGMPLVEHLGPPFSPGMGGVAKDGEYYKPVAAGQTSKSQFYDVLWCHGQGPELFGLHLEPGQYSAFLSNAKSDTLSFEEVGPLNHADSLAVSLFASLAGEERRSNTTYIHDLTASFIAFVDTCPSSPLAPRAYHWLLGGLAQEYVSDKAVLRRCALHFICDFPHDRMVDAALSYIDTATLTQDESRTLQEALSKSAEYFRNSTKATLIEQFRNALR